MKRYLVLFLAVLIATVFLAAGCGGGGGTSISGKYIYKSAPAGESPVLDFKSNGTVAISVPASTSSTGQASPAQNLNWYYQTSSDLVKLWKDKASMASSPPTPFFLIYKGTLVDGQGQVLVKQGTTTAPSSASAPSSTP